jgi:uncharacterized membrane protein YfcA
MDILMCISIIVIGIINGIFTSGAGQLFIFYFVYVLKKDTKKIRNISLTLMPLISIATFIFYCTKVKINLKISIILIFISLLFGFLGNKTMKKLNADILNLVSGILLLIITTISIWRTL